MSGKAARAAKRRKQKPASETLHDFLREHMARIPDMVTPLLKALREKQEELRDR